MSNFHRSCLSAIIVIAALGALVSGQTPQATAPAPGQPATTPQTPRTPPRPGRPGEPPPKGTAIIRGSVVAADTGQPLRRVQVRANSMDASMGRAGGITNTDAEGRFEIKDLPAGRYSLMASKGALVTMSYGARRPGDPGTPIEVSDGQIAEKVNFMMSRGAVITGRIVDDAGEPMAGVRVMAQRYAYMGGGRRLVPFGNGAQTDDTGTYRLYGLAPGDYYVNATGTGGMGFSAGPAMSTVETDGYAPTYYPGTPNVSEAQRLSVKVGQEVTAHFSLMPTRLVRVRGRVLTSRGEAARGNVMLMSSEPYMGVGMTTSSTQLSGDGSFQLNSVAPGRYNLTIRPMGMPGPEQEFAAMPITIGNEDLDNVMLTTSVAATASGVIQTDDGSPPPFRADEVQVFASSPDPMGQMNFGVGSPKINPDFTFELSSLSDRRLIRASVMNQPTWMLKAVFYDGTDVIDTGIEFTPGRSYEGVQVVFTQKTTDLSGLVSDSRGRPISDATVVVFPANREKWVGQSRYIRTARPDTQGRYSFKGLPPYDDYMIIAVQNLESGQGSDPDFLTRAREEGKSVGLNEGEKKAFDVKLSSLVP